MKQSSHSSSQSIGQSNHRWNNWLLVIAVVSLAVIPIIFIREEFGGADGEAEKAITEIQPEYKPWFQPVFEPPGGEIESLLFCSQAALGAGLLGYTIGLYRGRSQKQRNHESE